MRQWRGGWKLHNSREVPKGGTSATNRYGSSSRWRAKRTDKRVVVGGGEWLTYGLIHHVYDGTRNHRRCFYQFRQQPEISEH